jgi:tRNA(Arg) A34 adenosine deaminase TadA
MCYAATIWAKIPRFWFASESEDAARAGFDDAALYQLFRGIDGVTKVKGEHLLVAEHRSPFMEYEEALRHGMTELY